jgi:hypothetical protein
LTLNSGCQDGSAVVCGLPSVSARWIACTGRHDMKWNLASKHATPASPAETNTIASSRAVWPRSSRSAAASRAAAVARVFGAELAE